MHQEFSRARFLVAELAGRSVGADVDALEERLAVLDARITVAEIRAMGAQRFYLGAGEREPASSVSSMKKSWRALRLSTTSSNPSAEGLPLRV